MFGKGDGNNDDDHLESFPDAVTLSDGIVVDVKEVVRQRREGVRAEGGQFLHRKSAHANEATE